MNIIELRNKILDAIAQPICHEDDLNETFLERRIDEVLNAMLPKSPKKPFVSDFYEGLKSKNRWADVCIQDVETCEDLFSLEFTPTQKRKVANEMMMLDLDFDRYNIDEYPLFNDIEHGRNQPDEFVIYYTSDATSSDSERAWCQFSVFQNLPADEVPEFYYHVQFSSIESTVYVTAYATAFDKRYSKNDWFWQSVKINHDSYVYKSYKEFKVSSKYKPSCFDLLEIKI